MTPTLARTRTALPIAAAVAVATLALAIAAHGADPAPAGSAKDPSADLVIEPGISRPVDERKPTFPAPGLVTEVLVHEGDSVKAGQVLARQDDRQEQQVLEQDKMDAESTAAVRYQAVDVKHKEVQYDRKQGLYDQVANPEQPDQHSISVSEVEEAKLAMALSQAQVDVEQLNHDKKGRDYEKQKIKVDQMVLRAPFDGIIAKINVQGGEMADPQSKDGVLTIVRNDPLKIVIHPSSDRAMKLAPGEELQVRYAAPAGEPANPWMTAAIYYFAPQADASSKTEEVWLRLPNPTGQRSGLAVEVRLPANVAAVAGGPSMGSLGGPLAAESALPPLQR